MKNSTKKIKSIVIAIILAMFSSVVLSSCGSSSGLTQQDYYNIGYTAGSIIGNYLR